MTHCDLCIRTKSAQWLFFFVSNSSYHTDHGVEMGTEKIIIELQSEEKEESVYANEDGSILQSRDAVNEDENPILYSAISRNANLNFEIF